MSVKVKIKGKSFTLNTNDPNSFISRGGQANVFKANGNALKIYHPGNKVIPVGKIADLSKLDRPNILGPREPAYDSKGNVIGFEMPLIKDSEFMCRLFSAGFRKKSGIDEKTIIHLVKGSQETVDFIHAKKCLIVDCNPMNFLVDKAFKIPYFIDVDSWQTPNYPADALMDSVRDRLVENNKFTEGSDWFSWACVMFELYTGTHPYKGVHPKYNRSKEWQQMMDSGISVFNKDTRMPPKTQPLSAIPKAHLDWFERVFEKSERGVPPTTDGIVQVTKAKPKIVRSSGNFEVVTEYTLDSEVIAARAIQGSIYCLTKKGIYQAGNLIKSKTPVRGRTYDFLFCQGSRPLFVEHDRLAGRVRIETVDGEFINEINTSGFFVSNNKLFAVKSSGLIEFSYFLNPSNEVKHSQKVAANVFSNYQFGEEVLIQNILGTQRVTCCYGDGATATSVVRVKELEPYRIIHSAKKGRAVVVVGEKRGRVDRVVVFFDEKFKTYDVRITKGVDLEEPNLTFLDKGIYVMACGDTMEIFMNNQKVKIADNSPIDGDQKLISAANAIYAINDNEIVRVSLKK
jgi:hypothetical protein